MSIYSDELGRLIGRGELSRDMSASRGSLASLSLADDDDDSNTSSAYGKNDDVNDDNNHQCSSNVRAHLIVFGLSHFP